MKSVREDRAGVGFLNEFNSGRQNELFYVLLAFTSGVSLTLILYLVLSVSYQVLPLDALLGRASDKNLPWGLSVLVCRGILQPLNLMLFSFGASMLAIRLWSLRAEMKAFDEPFFANIPCDDRNEPVINEQTRGIPLQNVREIKDRYTGNVPLLIRRMYAGSRRLEQDGDANQVHAIMKAVGDLDRDAVENRYTLVRYLIWLIPTIGFLGTVIGIGRSITGFTGFLTQLGADSEGFGTSLQSAMAGIASELGVAFDTTVLALLLSALITAFISIVQSQDETLLTNIEDFCLRFFLSRIRVLDIGSKQIGMMITQSLRALSNAKGSDSTERKGDSEWRDLAGLLTKQISEISELARVLKQREDGLRDR